MEPKTTIVPIEIVGTPTGDDVATTLAGSGEHVAQFFTFAHLPPHLAAVSAPFALIAAGVIRDLPRNQQRTMALNKLLEAKDHAVRALIAKP